MEAKIVNSKELGLNCWSTLRFFGKCYKCPRYKYCRYPERVVNEEHDRLVANFSQAKKELEQFLSK